MSDLENLATDLANRPETKVSSRPFHLNLLDHIRPQWEAMEAVCEEVRTCRGDVPRSVRDALARLDEVNKDTD